jgi:hypothetical protein
MILSFLAINSCISQFAEISLPLSQERLPICELKKTHTAPQRSTLSVKSVAPSQIALSEETRGTACRKGPATKRNLHGRNTSGVFPSAIRVMTAPG